MPPVHPAEDGLVEALPGAVLTPAAEALVAGLPGAVALRQITPGTPGGQNPQDPVDHLPVLAPRATLPLRGRDGQQRRDDAPGGFGQLMPASNPMGTSSSVFWRTYRGRAGLSDSTLGSSARDVHISPVVP